MNRYSNIKAGENKACPCGSGTTDRRCNTPEDFSDSDRSLDRITTFAPGDTITLRFDEYVGHSGRFRIAFDPDGAELADFNQHILLDEPDPEGKIGNVAQASLWEFQVTLPNMTCDNCTLQLIQVMDGNMEEQVLDPSTRGGTYFQCADIVLANGTPAGGLAPVNPSDHFAERRRPERASADPAATAETAPPPMIEAVAMVAPVSSGASSTAAEDGNTTMSSRTAEERGCSLAAGSSPRGPIPTLALVASAAAVAVLRRRR
ncbi:MAG: hypothetical protein RL685_7711 [Pseudomonadota bacterium]